MVLDPHVQHGRVTRAEDERRLLRLEHERIEALKEGCPPTQAQHGDRPTPKAQWDEAHGRWIEWDDAENDWRVVGDDATEGFELAAGASADEEVWTPDRDALDDIE